MAEHTDMGTAVKSGCTFPNSFMAVCIMPISVSYTHLDVYKRQVYTAEEAKKAANELGYPVLVRPSYVLGGQGMQILSLIHI